MLSQLQTLCQVFSLFQVQVLREKEKADNVSVYKHPVSSGIHVSMVRTLLLLSEIINSQKYYFIYISSNLTGTMNSEVDYDSQKNNKCIY